jgi:nickel/cobalt exporter
MEEQIISALLISVLHGLIPGHWLPFLALAKQENWSMSVTLKYTSMAATAHALGTIIIGLVVYGITVFGSSWLSYIQESIPSWILTDIPFEKTGGVLLISMGIFFLYRHHKHKHFHFPMEAVKKGNTWVLGSILVSLFLSPCMEIEVYFATLATEGFAVISVLMIVYFFATWISMTAGVYVGYSGLQKWNSHRLEHNVGIVSGVIMILSGVMLMYF